jgi:hypothetical protein
VNIKEKECQRIFLYMMLANFESSQALFLLTFSVGGLVGGGVGGCVGGRVGGCVGGRIGFFVGGGVGGVGGAFGGGVGGKVVGGGVVGGSVSPVGVGGDVVGVETAGVGLVVPGAVGLVTIVGVPLVTGFVGLDVPVVGEEVANVG